jgi:hypothetical protein
MPFFSHVLIHAVLEGVGQTVGQCDGGRRARRGQAVARVS